MVEPEELSLIPLSEEETAKIQAEIKRINADKIFSTGFGIFMGIPFLVVNILTYRIGGYNLEFILMFGLISLVFWLFALLQFLTRIPQDTQCIHAQYGVVNGKWSHNSSSGSSNRKFYLDVVFPETSTRYKQALCTKNDYEQAELGQRVFTFVLDGRLRHRVYASLMD